MINNLLNGIIQLILNVLGFISGLILKPITALIIAIFPDLDNYIDTVITFLNDYAFKGLAFARECFFNITGASREIFALFINLFFLRIAIKYSLQAFYFIKNMWALYKGNQGGGEMVE